MNICFICDAELCGQRTQVCSSIAPHCEVSYAEKIAELIEDDNVVVIVTPDDHVCMKCTSLLTFLDKTENELKLVKNAMLSFIKKKYGILPPDHVVEDVNIVNGHLVAENQVEQGQHNIPSDLTTGVSSTVTTAPLVMPVQNPSKMLKTQQQSQQKQQQQQPPTQQKSVNKIKIYKCGFCLFHSKEIGHVRFHMRTHVNTKKPEKCIPNQATNKALTPIPKQKKKIYRCKICSKSFNSQSDCLDHINKYHNRLIPSTSNAEKRTGDSHLVTSKVVKPEPPYTQENNQQGESPMDVDKHQQDDNKGPVDTDMILNNYVLTEGSAEVDQKEETENSLEDKTVKEAKTELKPEPALENAAEEEVDQETQDSENDEDEDNEK